MTIKRLAAVEETETNTRRLTPLTYELLVRAKGERRVTMGAVSALLERVRGGAQPSPVGADEGSRCALRFICPSQCLCTYTPALRANSTRCWG